MLPDTVDLLGQLKALADPVRMRLVALCRHGECSVSELTAVSGSSQPRVSQHLKLLCDSGLLERFRDGQRVYYRVPARGGGAAARRELLRLIPTKDPEFVADAARLRRLRSSGLDEASASTPDEPAADRDLHRAIVDLTVTTPVGDLLDIGCGRGRLLKLLASRAHRAVGVDIDASAREVARAELLLAGLPNCSLRAGDMYQLPFAAGEFDTVILDDVLVDADDPVAALREARRLLAPGGQLFILAAIGRHGSAELKQLLAGYCADSGLRLAPARVVPKQDPAWLIATARPAESSAQAA